MRGVLTIALAALLAGQVVAQDKTKKPAAARSAGGAGMESLQDKASYAIGNNIGSGMRKQGVDLNVELFVQGLREGLAGTDPKLTEEEMQTVFEQFQKEVTDGQLAKNEKAGQAFLAANKKKPGVKVTNTGLQYKVIKAGTGKAPTKTDIIRAHYRGTLTDGTEFDSSHKRGQPATFAVNQVIPGWTEALLSMPVGSKWQLVIPPDLAYGAEGFAPAIGPNATLVFEIELLGIEKPVSRLPSKGRAHELPQGTEVK
jgi:FKBP-type peptidyl-prolyl cis-trans isomerase FklB